MIKLNFRNLLVAALFAIGITAGGGAAVSAMTTANVSTVADADNTQQGQAGTEQTGESVNDNKDDKEVGNKDEGQVGQTGVQETGQSVNDNKDEGQVGEK
jgi:hypothetical protein